MSTRFRPARAGPRLAFLFLATSALVVSLVGGCHLDRPSHATVSAASRRPNIVLVLADDLDTASMADLPVLRRTLTARGMSFRHFYVSDPLCCPSRVSILRGQYVTNHHVSGNVGAHGGYRQFMARSEERSTVATWLQNAGYRTGFYGKYLNGYPLPGRATHVPPGWNDWHAAYGDAAYRQFGYHMVDNGRRTRHGHRASDYGVDVLARKAAAFVRAERHSTAPLFLYLSVYSPHGPAAVAPRYRGSVPQLRAPRGPAFNQVDMSRASRWLRMLSRLTPSQVATVDWAYRRRIRSVLAVQDLVVRLLAALRDTHRLSDTYVFFTSDNGYHLGQHRLFAGKRTAFETDIRVPMIVRGPGVPQGRTVRSMTSTIDLAPTFAALAGAAPPGFVDGRSLVPLLDGRPPPSWRRAVLSDYQRNTTVRSRDPDWKFEYRHPPELGLPSFHAVRTDRYTYVEHPRRSPELYDNRRDPQQLVNRYGDTAPATLDRLHRLLDRLLDCSGATCRAADRTLVRKHPRPAGR